MSPAGLEREGVQMQCRSPPSYEQTSGFVEPPRDTELPGMFDTLHPSHHNREAVEEDPLELSRDVEILESFDTIRPTHDHEVVEEVPSETLEKFDTVEQTYDIEVVKEIPPEPSPADQGIPEEDQSTERDHAAILASVHDMLSHLSTSPPMVEFIFETGEPSTDVPIILPSPPPAQPILKLDTSVVPSIEPFYSPSYESPSQRRRRERRTSGHIQVATPDNAVAISNVSIDVLPTPRGRRSRRPHSPDRRRDGEIQVLDESDEDRDTVVDFRGRQKKRPSELRCFPVNSLGPKRAYPGVTPISPGGSGSFDFRRMPTSPPVHKKLASLGSENIPRVGKVVAFVSTPISPVPEDCNWP